MKWTLVLALVLCCGWTKGETEDDRIESLDKLTEQLEQELLFRPRTLLSNTHKCGEIVCQNAAEDCTEDDKCDCLTGFTGEDCTQVVCGDNNCENGALKCKEGEETKCDCPEGTTGDDCSEVTGCIGSLKDLCEKLALKCIYDSQTLNKAACECTENKKFDGETCKETCDTEKNKCDNDAICETKDGYNFCTCVPGLTGDLCKNITACETGGKYEKCSAGGGTCKFSGGQATCVCEAAKQFDTNSGQCRSTCDSKTNNCENEAECEDQGGQTFCTCTEGLTGDLCEVITDCQKGKKYENCSSNDGHKCQFSKKDGKAFCECADGKQFDTKVGLCRSTCDSKTNICENGAECEDQGGQTFCTCTEGLAGDLCEVITDCQKGKKYENCSSSEGHKCQFSKKDGKAFCECADGKQFDTKIGLCRSTCDSNTKKCVNGATCEDQGGQTFCTCPEGLTGDLCDEITDCQKGKKYEKCSAGGGTCKFSNDDGKAVCECGGGKYFDTKMGKCRSTCDSTTKKCVNGAKCEDQDGHSFCTCAEGLAGDLCQIITDCKTGGKYENCTALYNHECTFSNKDGKAVCKCADDKKFDTRRGQCSKTCEDDDQCAKEFRCGEPIEGYKFCVCKEFMTGYDCNLVKDCLPSGKYANCKKAGGSCWHNEAKSKCDCKDSKEYDIKSEACRATCDPTNSECAYGAKCEEQDGKNFCTCVPGLTGDLCNIINECQLNGKYGKCESSGGNCTFSGGNAICSCGTGKVLDPTDGQCKDACGTVICRNGAQCKDGKCECPTGLSGADCGTVDGCTEDLEKICQAIPSKCIYDSKKENKASCECTNDKQKFDGETCKDCSCGENEVCFFDEKKQKQCPCIDKFSKNNGACQQCYCGEFGSCTFVEGSKKCNCKDNYKEKKGICEVCDCGEHGTCSFDNDGKKNCACNAKFGDKNGTCVDCECGEEAKSCQFNNDVKTCNCNSKYADKDGTCSECNCGEITKEAKSCKFNKGEKECDCVSLYAPKDGKCTDCGCGNTTVVEGCEFKDDETFCKCKKNFSQKDKSCEACDCGKYGNCSFVGGEKKCACNVQYKEDEGICKFCDCGENGECLFEDHKKTCECKDGFAELNGKCEECDCGKDGECSFENNKKICSCNEGYSEYNGICTEPCKSNNDCEHNNITTCKEKTKGVSFCDCKKIFTGHKCEKVVECETGVLKNCSESGGTCSYNFKQAKAICECNEEKKFDKVLNICRAKCKPEGDTCKNGAKCQDELCVCPKGTSGDDCATVDGCDPDFKEKCENIKATCVYDNTTNSATCQCENNDLEYKDNKCTAKWCDSNPCKAKVSVCVYGFRSAFCKCTESGKYYDYATNNCIAIDKCPFAPCKENEICTDDGTCVCDKNHEKDKDGCKKKNLCTPSPCSLNATCEEGKSIGTVKCECPSHTYLNAKSTCEVMIKEEDKCKDGKYCGPFGYCVKDGDTSKCACKKDLAVLDNTGVCILNGQKACLSKTVLSNDNKKCNCSGKLKDSTNGITCESMTCGDEAAQQDCKSKGAYCVDTKDSNNKLKTYDCECSAGQTLTKDKGCVDACSDKAGECAKNQQTCYIDENGFATCKCPPGFTEINTNGKITCQLNVQFSYILKELPVMKKEFLNEDQSLNKVKLNQYVIKSMKALSSTSYEFASVQNFRISDDVILCDVWLKFNKDAEQDVKRWRSQVVITNDSFVLPPSLKLSSVELNKVTYEKLEFCSPLVYQTACGRQGSKCDKNACSCMDGYDVVGPTVQVIEGNTVMRCEDIDECKENKHSCKANSECKNIMGGHYCKCNPGFHKKDKNESEDCVELCSPNPCTNGDCAVDEKENRVECSCKAGFKGSYCAESDDELKKAQHSTKVVGAVLGTILAVTFVAIIAYVVKLKKNSYSEDFSSGPRDNSEMAERPLRGMSNRGYQ